MSRSSPLPPQVLGPRLMEVFGAVGPLYRLAARQVGEDENIEGVTTGERAVLERLVVGGDATVPEIAAHLATSRQWVQRSVDACLSAGWVERYENPAHRRSWLVTPTDGGRAAIARIREREEQAMGETSGDLTGADVDTCIRVLDAMRNTLERRATMSG